MNERAFVAGATGLTGRAVVRHLRSRGAEVLAHVRPDSGRLQEHRAFFESLGASVDTTAWEQGPMTQTLEAFAPQVVFSLLGTTRKRARDAGEDAARETYEVVDYGLTNLLRLASEASGHAPRFVYLSCVGVNPEKDTRNAYMQVRVRVERDLGNGALPYTCIRPAVIHGDRDEPRVGEAVGAAIVDGALAVVGAFGGRNLRERYRSMTGDDLGRACVRLAFDPAAENRAFEPDELRA